MDPLSAAEKSTLLRLARSSLEAAVRSQPEQPLDLGELSERLQSPGASFVTLTRRGALRGCIGALEPHQPLADDVREHAAAAALSDYRFPPVAPDELPEIEIEVSVLTLPQVLTYSDSSDLLAKLRPHVDGVTLRDGWHRATFLPQVWEKIPNPELFLSYLCDKMGAPPDHWRQKKLEVFTYQVEEFREAAASTSTAAPPPR